MNIVTVKNDYEQMSKWDCFESTYMKYLAEFAKSAQFVCTRSVFTNVK